MASLLAMEVTMALWSSEWEIRNEELVITRDDDTRLFTPRSMFISFNPRVVGGHKMAARKDSLGNLRELLQWALHTGGWED